jgi:hypothetical protein
MKRFYIILTAFLFLQFVSYSQMLLFNLKITFEDSAKYAVIDPNQVNNIWQKGAPHKTFFDSAYSVPYAIMTDTADLYPVNNFSSFTVKMEYLAGCWGTGFLGFWHKFQTDSTHAGGFIDVSYDTSGTFHNIIFDTIEPLMGWISLDNFYTENDTITGNIPAFTGNSNGWNYSSVHWIWQIGVDRLIPEHDSLTIRFNFKSDGIAIPEEGWMIDNIYIELDACSGGVPTMNIQKRVSIYPSPVGEAASIALVNFSPGEYQLEILDEMGRTVIHPRPITLPVYHFINPGLSDGVYFYRISDADGKSITGKMVILR